MAGEKRSPPDGRQSRRFPSLIVGAPAVPTAARNGLVDRMVDLFLTPERSGLGRRNRLSNFTFFFLAAAVGSGATVVASVLGGWALLSVLVGRYRWRLEPPGAAVALSLLVFFLVLAASDIVHGPLSKADSAVVALLPFILPMFLIPRMQLSRFADTLPPAFFGSVIGGIVLLPLALTEFWQGAERIEVFADNPGPLSVTSLLCAGWSILHFRSSQPRWHLLLVFAGVFGASVAVFLSGMRGAWPLLPLCLGIAFFTQRREFAAVWRDSSARVRAAGVGLLVLVLGAALFVVLPPMLDRLDQMQSDLTLIVANADTPTSLNYRKEMYAAAIQAIEARPWFGYGSKNHWQALTPYLNPVTFQGVRFTHSHNVFLSVAVNAGVIGVVVLIAVILSPVIVAWRARGTVGGGRRLGAALILLVAFLGAGMTNIMLFNRVLDPVWVFAVSLIAASIPPAAAGEDGGDG